jgi:hypothetical protein
VAIIPVSSTESAAQPLSCINDPAIAPALVSAKGGDRREHRMAVPLAAFAVLKALRAALPPMKNPATVWQGRRSSDSSEPAQRAAESISGTTNGFR